MIFSRTRRYPRMSKKTKRRIFRVSLIVIPLLLMALLAYWISNWYYKPSFVHYPAFGIDIPVNYSIHGIDVSKHQKTIGWQEVKNMEYGKVKIGFAIMKATEGLGRVDEQFRRNWLHAKRAGISRGAYHFFIASKSGKAQAENFMETVRLEKGDLPPVLDVEQTYGTDKATLQQRVHDWLMAVERRYGMKPILYSNVDFYETYLADRFGEYPLWVAHYFAKEKPRTNHPWIFWQHSETGRVNGIGTAVDFNVFKGDSAAFRSLLKP